MWQLQSDQGNQRTYTNHVTGSRCSTKKLYTDKEKNDWYGFTDLLAMPHTRRFACLKISALYQLGLTKEDLNGHILKLKTLAKSNDSERFEKIYALALDFQSKVENATDPIRQLSALTCVYYLLGSERVDAFDNEMQTYKMGLMENDLELQSFFLNRQIEDIEQFQTRSNLITQIVSNPVNGM